MASCIFCSIVRGDAAAEIVYADGSALAFLDTAPLMPGHTLVITREHIETLDELPAGLIEPFFSLVQRVSRVQQSALSADGTFAGINTRVSQSVAHLHVHVVPRRRGDGLFGRGMVWVRKRYSAGEAEAVAAKMREALART